jgi:ADP-heptose:LPS heptosyltransferase
MDVHLIGDLVLLTPMFAYLKLIYPDARITLLAGPWARSVFMNFDEIDFLEFIEVPWVKYDKKFHRFCSLVRKVFKLRKINFDLTIEIRGDIRNQVFLRLSGSKNIVSYSFFGMPYFIDQVVPLKSDLKHLISYNSNIFSFLNSNSSNFQFVPFLKFSDKEISSLKKVEKYIGIHFGASLPMRRPNDDLLKLWLDQIVQSSGNNLIVIFDTPEDANFSFKLQGMLLELNVNSKIWKGGLREFMVYLNKCEYLFCLDSAPGHIASTLNIPSSVIFGPTFETVASPISGRTKIVSSKLVGCKDTCDQLSCKNEVFQGCYPTQIC